MATYSFHSEVPFYQGTDGYWGSDTFGSIRDGHPIGGKAPSSYLYQWRSIIGFDITPATGEKITSFTINIGFMRPTQTTTPQNVALGGYLYNSLETAKSKTNDAPSGYIGHSAEPSAIYVDATGRMTSLTYSGLNITTKTSLYIWFYVNPGGYFELWSGNSTVSDNIQEATISFATEALSYTATFDANGGTTANPQTITKDYGEALGTLPTTSRAGYTFNGWYTAKTGGSKISTTTTMPANNVTYYAQWSIIQYTVSYNANGGTGAPSAQTKDYGKTLTLSSTKPTWATSTDATYTITYNANGGSCSADKATVNKTTSHTFKNWNTTVGGTGDTYVAGASYTKNASATLYAQWTSSTTTPGITLPVATKNSESLASCTVTFNANGGNCNTSSLTSTRTKNYTFKGWSTNSSATSGSTGSYTPTASTTLYATWQETVVSSAVTLPEPTRENYEFKGWAISADATSGSFGSYVPSESVILYAIWESSTGTTTETGLIYIDSGSGWETYEIYIDNGASWDKYIPYIDNGAGWELYG